MLGLVLGPVEVVGEGKGDAVESCGDANGGVIVEVVGHAGLGGLARAQRTRMNLGFGLGVADDRLDAEIGLGAQREA